MKRYSRDVGYDGGHYVHDYEDDDGDWVRFEDAAKLQAVVDALPRCDCCPRFATHATPSLSGEVIIHGCDEHSCQHDMPLPYADALRGLESK